MIDILTPPGALPSGSISGGTSDDPERAPNLFPSSTPGPLPGDKAEEACALGEAFIGEARVGDAFKFGAWDSPLYVRGEDNCRVVVFNEVAGVQVSVQIRVKTPAGEIIPFVQTFAPTSNRVASTFVFGLMEGAIISADAICSSGAPVAGQCYCFLQLVRGLTGAITRVLNFAQGYITANDSLFFPADTYLDSLSSVGFQRTVQQANPGAGADWTLTVPASVRWQLQTVFALLTTSAAAANRLPRLIIDDGVNIIWQSPAQVNETASLAWGNNWGAGAGSFAAADPNNVQQALPNDLFLLAGWRVRVLTANIQAGDQWSAISIAVRSWIDT
jgi:hypothetical protein